MCANLVGARREILKKCARSSRLKIKFSADMVKRVSKSSVKGTFAQMHYGEERNSVKVQLKDIVKRESLAKVRKTISVVRITFRTSQHNSRVGNHLPNIEK